MILFVAMQVFVGYKHGLVVSPFFNYGMYSHEINIEKNYPVFEVKANGRLLRGQDFSPQQWDKIMLPVNYYANIHRSNDLYENEVKRLLGRLHISTEERKFLQQCDAVDFEKWYAKYLETVTGHLTNNLEISCRYYLYDGRLQPTDSVIKLAELCR